MLKALPSSPSHGASPKSWKDMYVNLPALCSGFAGWMEMAGLGMSNSNDLSASPTERPSILHRPRGHRQKLEGRVR